MCIKMTLSEFFKKYGALLTVIFGLCSILTGIVLVLFWPKMFDYIFFKQLVLKPGSKSYGFWTEPPQPLYLDIYLWNWTNPEDIRNNSIKPNFVQIGPFRFQEYPSKTNVKFHDNSTVSYRKSSKYFFIPEDSRGQLDDVITSLNVISLAAATRAKNWGYFASKAISMSFSFYDQKIHVTKTASEWLFEGFDDPLINIAASNPLLNDIPKYADKFGWFYKKNNTDFMLGDFNINTGADDIQKIGLIRQWNNVSRTNFFSQECSELSGSGGDFFVPNITKDQILELFSPEMCRSVPMEFEEEVTIHEIKTLKFSGGDKAVDNGTLYPENECYCSGECVPSGLFNVSSCRYGTPVFMSFPHFYHADPFYHRQIDGMSPEKAKHQFFMSFEPKTAIPLEVAARFQINLLLDKIQSIGLYRDIPRVFVPVLWFEQHVTMSESIANEIKLVLNLPLMGQIMGVVICIIGLITLLIIPLLRLCSCAKNHKVIDVNCDAHMKEKKINEVNGSLPEAKKLLNKDFLFRKSVK